MHQLLEKLSEVYEKGYAKVPADARNKVYLEISLRLMTKVNGVIQANINQWPIELTRLYGQRMLYCNHIHTAIQLYIDKSLKREELQLAINSITLLYKSTLKEQQPNLDPDNVVLYKRVVEGVLLPQFLILRYLNQIYHENF